MKYRVRMGFTVIFSMVFLFLELGNCRVWSFVNQARNPEATEFDNVMNASVMREVNHSVYKSEEKCSQCHPRLFPSHVLAKPLRMSAYLNLDVEGKMGCITCHKCSSNKCELRRNKTELCMICHDCEQGMSCILGVAHLGNSHNNIDIDARTCLACHDGVIGPAKNAKGLMINKHYRIKDGFRDISNTGIMIVNGIITCVSCHNPYKSKGKRLVISYEGNRLCVTCHKK